MNTKKKIAFATGSRADYGIVRRYLSLLNQDESIDLSILTTGALLESKYGNAVDLIGKDGFKIDCRIPLNIKTEKVSDTIDSMSVALKEFGHFFENNKYDLVIILGDRYEVLSVAIACAMNRIPILHIHGGEITLGNYDEFIRHAITKMSTYHFTSTEEYRQRVIQLGENPENVYYLGALGVENCLQIDENNVLEELKDIEEKCFTVLFHPETLTGVSPEIQIKKIIDAISKYIDKYKFVFIGSNADTMSHKIFGPVKDFCDEHKDRTMFYLNMHPDSYHYLLKKSIALIGNSSSGIIEAPSLNTLTINIGDRQAGRVMGNSVLSVKCETEDIIGAIDYAIKNNNNLKNINPYFKENTANNYYLATLKILSDDKHGIKQFYDIKDKGNI